ncbi:nuclear RNA export factor 1 [Drosophila elegans]|uniref:nuclear RNA export factor 1 n=1 Tax=Drosophila elegans TaxID=30023 RepID=UPI0007E605CE|nr:nuclear RNA export factor 1 [Drosophila elegans]
MFVTPRRNSSEGPLCHSTPRSDRYEPRPKPNLPVSVYGWYRVLIFSSDRRQSINRVMRQLRRSLCPLKLDPRYLHSGGEPDVAEDFGALCTFYVDGYNIASALFRLGRLDERVWLMVSDRMPRIRIDSEYRRRLRRVLLTRYDRQQRSLDLTLFHNDEAWRGEFCALAQPDCMSTVIGIMEREMPELGRLILDRNHLTHLWPFDRIERRLPRLQCVSLKYNDIESLYLLRVFRFLTLVELNLERNLLPAGYERDVPYLWPSLEVLNESPVEQTYGY